MPLLVITSNLFSNYFVTDEYVRRTIKKCCDRFKNRVVMLQLQPGCKGYIVLKAQRCGTNRMIGALTIT